MRMRNYFLLCIVMLITSCNNNKQTNNNLENNVDMKQEENLTLSPQMIKERIEKVPISSLPLGLANIDKVDSLVINNETGPFKLPIDYELDLNNKYGLNNIDTMFYVGSEFDYFGISGMLADSKDIKAERKVYFSKRLPSKDNYEILLFKHLHRRVNQHPAFNNQQVYEIWALVFFKDGEVEHSKIIGYSVMQEEIQRFYVVFNIDKDYNLTLRAYKTDYYRELDNAARCFAYQKFAFYKDVNSSYFQLENEGTLVEESVNDEEE